MLSAAKHRLRAGIGRLLQPPPDPEADLRALRDTLIYTVGALVAGGRIRGDYLEFGVYTGSSFTLAYKAIRQAFVDTATPNKWNTAEDCAERRQIWEAMRFLAFDSFAGLPEPSGADAYTGQFTAGKFQCSEADFRGNLRAAGVPGSKTRVVAGFFDQVLNQKTIEREAIRTVAIAHIDVDLYESAKLALDFLAPLLVDGSVLIFDDWFQFRGRPDMGERRALSEWTQAHPALTVTEYRKWGPWANSFIVNTATPYQDTTLKPRT